jgi:hypothetical protein
VRDPSSSSSRVGLKIAPRNSAVPAGRRVIGFLFIISFVPSNGKRNSSWPGSKCLNTFTSMKSWQPSGLRSCALLCFYGMQKAMASPPPCGREAVLKLCTLTGRSEDLVPVSWDPESDADGERVQVPQGEPEPSAGNRREGNRAEVQAAAKAAAARAVDAAVDSDPRGPGPSVLQSCIRCFLNS